jgi:hypothetical protein
VSETTTSEDEVTIKRLNWIRIVAIVDFLILVPLVIASLNDSDDLISVLGPIHGVGFLILAFLCVQGVGQGRWGWWFPAVVIVTLGPPGSLWGEHRIRRQLERP